MGTTAGPAGEVQLWDIVNDSPVDHPFHLHGFFFQVLEVNGRPPEFLSWQDTSMSRAKVAFASLARRP